MGLSEESVHLLNIHTLYDKKKMNNDFQCFGDESIAYISFSRIISEKCKKKKKIEIKLP